ncbi:MAG: AMIN domain-containing protein [Campylobacterota bacterium]|nr:AMIN domain-containing protein [Campylobacterota bacterium]
MFKILLIALFFISILQARENPFFPSKGEKDILYTTDQAELSPPLKRSSISLPSSARVIKKVIIEYENLDATLDRRAIELDNSVDWHLPIFISQNYSSTQGKSITTQSKKYKKLGSIKHAGFYSSGKTLKISTKDKVIRNFLLVNPYRIVIDFKRDTNLKTYTKELPNNIFSRIRVGNHSGYYRVVVELDGQYRYAMKKVSDGYLFRVR